MSNHQWYLWFQKLVLWFQNPFPGFFFLACIEGRKFKQQNLANINKKSKLNILYANDLPGFVLFSQLEVEFSLILVSV